MKSRLLFLSLIFLFWTGFFLVCRILFLLFHIDQSASLSAYEWFMINGLGLRMDLSMAGYLTLLPAVGMIFSFAVSDKIMVKIIHFINLVYLISCSVIVSLIWNCTYIGDSAWTPHLCCICNLKPWPLQLLPDFFF